MHIVSICLNYITYSFHFYDSKYIKKFHKRYIWKWWSKEYSLFYTKQNQTFFFFLNSFQLLPVKLSLSNTFLLVFWNTFHDRSSSHSNCNIDKHGYKFGIKFSSKKWLGLFNRQIFLFSNHCLFILILYLGSLSC